MGRSSWGNTSVVSDSHSKVRAELQSNVQPSSVIISQQKETKNKVSLYVWDPSCSNIICKCVWRETVSQPVSRAGKTDNSSISSASLSWLSFYTWLLLWDLSLTWGFHRPRQIEIQFHNFSHTFANNIAIIIPPYVELLASLYVTGNMLLKRYMQSSLCWASEKTFQGEIDSGARHLCSWLDVYFAYSQ